MKISWGHGITAVIILFMGFILFMVFKASQTKPDLLYEDYYDREIAFQQKINAKHNTSKLKESIQLNWTDEGLKIELPNEFKGTSIKASVDLLKPNNASFDKHYDFEVSNGTFYLSKKDVIKGSYTITINWAFNNQQYYFEKDIFIE